MPAAKRLSGTDCWVLTDGKIGDRVQCLGVAEHLGLNISERTVAPRVPWSWLAPRGPVDPREAPGRSLGPLAGTPPSIAIASGRRTVPYLRALKAASGGRTFTVFLKDPTIGTGAADLIWVPEHDRLRGANVVVTLTSPSRLTPTALERARTATDPRLADLPKPRVAILLGGQSRHVRFTEPDIALLAGIARGLLETGRSLMVTPSRRTPPPLIEALLALSREPRFAGRCFVWAGDGDNPYIAMLALAQALVVTGDSVNMLGEAAMTGAPIHVVEATGGHAKITRFVDGLVAHGAAVRWRGQLESFAYAPLDATPLIAGAIETAYAAASTDHMSDIGSD